MSDAKPVILLVDDDPDILKLLSMRLNASGYEVQAVESGHLALSALAASRPLRDY
jgi:two-component system response regulator GlrR